MTDFMKPTSSSLFDSTNQWIEIAVYRGFYDVPRLILAKTVESTFWILESVFDDELDDYQGFYRIYAAGDDDIGALACFERHLQGTTGARLGQLPIADFVFDATKRAAFKIAGAVG